MRSKLESSFFTYVSFVIAAFDRKKVDDSHTPINLPRLPLLGVDYSRREGWENERLFLESEESDEFNQLVADTRSCFSDESPAFQGLWEVAVRNFLRRSGVYLEIFDSKDIDISAVFNDYYRAFKRQHNQEEYQRHYLALIENVAFHERLLDFGSFQIRQFTAEELGKHLGDRVKCAFYPDASLRAREVKKLADYWFIYVTEPAVAEPVGGRQYVDYFDPLIRIQHTNFPRCVESALKRLALYDWNYDWETSYVLDSFNRDQDWFRFKVPFVLVVDENPLRKPNAAPDLSVLTMRDYFDEDGEWAGLEPDLEYLTNEGSSFFVKSVNDVESLLANLKPDMWPFFEIAIGYFLRAFLSEGPEQLLWHITVLDALLGDNEGGGRTKRIQNRLGSILGQGAEEIAIRKQFQNLYDFRNAVVHGFKPKRDVYRGHLREARELARRSLWWFLSFLNHIQDKLSASPKGESLQLRQYVLKLIDLDVQFLLPVMEGLPEGFPHVPEWNHRTPETRNPATTRW